MDVDRINELGYQERILSTTLTMKWSHTTVEMVIGSCQRTTDPQTRSLTAIVRMRVSWKGYGWSSEILKMSLWVEGDAETLSRLPEY